MYLETMLTGVLKSPVNDNILGLSIMTDGTDSRSSAGALTVSSPSGENVYGLPVPDRFRYISFERLNRISYQEMKDWPEICPGDVPGILGDRLAVTPNLKFLLKLLPEAESWNIVETGDLQKVRDGGLYCRTEDLSGFVRAVRNYGYASPRISFKKVIETDPTDNGPGKEGTHGEYSARMCRYQALRLIGSSR